MKATDRPWHLNNEGCILDAQGYQITRPALYQDSRQTPGVDSAFIVQAVNAHDALVDALRLIVQGDYEGPGYVEGITKARALLAEIDK